MKWTILTKVMLLLVAMIAFSCNSPEQQLKYDESLKCDSLNTEDTTDKNAPHSIECNVFIDNDTLVIDMPAELAGGWRYVTMKVYNGQLHAETSGIPFEPITISFKTINQNLTLNKKQYALNDTLCGHFDLTFQDYVEETKEMATWDFKGTICEIVRTKNFGPFDAENFMTFDLPAAIHKLGEPLGRETFDMENVPEFRIELLRYFRPSKDIIIEELTWDISDTRDISDEGRERLTIWYAPKNNRWLPVHYMKWPADADF